MTIPPYSLNAIVGMLVLGATFSVIGSFLTVKTLLKGEVVVVARFKVVIREKLTQILPLRFNYFYALFYTMFFGPALLIIGLISFYVFLSSLI